MTKIWGEVFWKKLPETSALVIDNQRELFKRKWLMIIPVLILTALILLMGLYAKPFIEYSMRVAEQLFDKQSYINAVFNW
jgi:multicomponent Na+:H+ antiporter subunit D